MGNCTDADIITASPEEESKSNKSVTEPPPPVECPEISPLDIVTIPDFIHLSISIIFYLMDISADAYLASAYFTSGQTLYFGLTLSFVLTPMIVTSLFSLIWYKRDSNDETSPKASREIWAIRILFATIGMAPLLRYLTALLYGIKSSKASDPSKRQQYRTWMRREDNDFSFLRLFEAFMESAPQLILHLVIILKQSSVSEQAQITHQISFRLFLAFLSLGCATTGFNRAARSSEGKRITPFLRTAHFIHIFWHFFTICARILALAVFASFYPVAMIISCLLHWILMVIWFSFQDFNNWTEWTWEGKCLKVVAGFVYIFTFFSLQDGKTRSNYIFYYSLIFIENIAMLLICIWEFEIGTGLVIFFGDIILFWSGIGFMLIYYKFCHPTVGTPINCRIIPLAVFRINDEDQGCDKIDFRFSE